jgi:hypothetical protein
LQGLGPEETAVSNTMYFLGVRDGKSAKGALLFPEAGKSFNASSGTVNSLWRLPEGTYKLGDREWGEAAVSLGPAKYKYRLAGVTKEGKRSTEEIWDPTLEKNRSRLLVHPDGNGTGSMGCISVRGTNPLPGSPAAVKGPKKGVPSTDVAAAQEVDGLIGGMEGEKTVIVKYFDTVEEMEAFQRQQVSAAPLVPRTEAYDAHMKDAKKRSDATLKALEEQKAAARKRKKAKPSRTSRQATLIRGERSVVCGTDQLPVAFANGACQHDGGAKIAKGSDTVYVGRQMRELARVADLHVDGQVVKTGAEGIWVG